MQHSTPDIVHNIMTPELFVLEFQTIFCEIAAENGKKVNEKQLRYMTTRALSVLALGDDDMFFAAAKANDKEIKSTPVDNYRDIKLPLKNGEEFLMSELTSKLQPSVVLPYELDVAIEFIMLVVGLMGVAVSRLSQAQLDRVVRVIGANPVALQSVQTLARDVRVAQTIVAVGLAILRYCGSNSTDSTTCKKNGTKKKANT